MQWKSIRPKLLIHIELADFKEKSILKYLLQTYSKKIDSLGFNDDELLTILKLF